MVPRHRRYGETAPVLIDKNSFGKLKQWKDAFGIERRRALLVATSLA